MKTVTVCLLLAAFIVTVIPASAGDTTDYGRKVDIIVDFDFENVDHGNEEESLWWGRYSSVLAQEKYWPSWSPDGKWIGFTLRWPSNTNWIVTPEGGEPVHINDQTGGQVRFSSDGKEVFYAQGYIIEKNNITYPITNIECVNIETGERRIVVEEMGNWFSISKDDRYLCYINMDHRIYLDESQVERLGVPAVYDMVTGETWYLTDEETAAFYETEDGQVGRWYKELTISPDNSNVVMSIYDYEEKTTQLYRIPIEGGEPEQLTFYNENDSYTKSHNRPEFSPDGKWILFYEYSHTDKEESPYVKVRRMCVYNTETGNIYKVFENATRSNADGSWSPDGTQICYCLINDERLFDLYICDFDPDNLRKPLSVEAVKPSSFALLRNYPNPFNPNTTIEFSLPESGFVSLVIYDITGQRTGARVRQHDSGESFRCMGRP